MQVTVQWLPGSKIYFKSDDAFKVSLVKQGDNKQQTQFQEKTSS